MLQTSKSRFEQDIGKDEKDLLRTVEALAIVAGSAKLALFIRITSAANPPPGRRAGRLVADPASGNTNKALA